MSMAKPSKPYAFTVGTIGMPDEVNADFDILYSKVGEIIDAFAAVPDINFKVSSMYSSLTAAVATIGSVRTRLYVDTDTSLTAHTVVPETLELVVTRAGTVAKGSFNLEVGGEFYAGKHKVFTGTGVATFTGKPQILRPDWWDAPGDGTTVCGTKFKEAFEATVKGNHILLLSGQYVVDEELLSSIKESRSHSWVIEGETSTSGVIAKIAGGAVGASKKLFKVVGDTSLHEPYGFAFRNFNIYGDVSCPYVDGIYVEHGHMWHAENCELNCNGRSVYIKGSIYSNLTNIRSWTSGATGGTGQPTQQLIYLYGDATYPVNDITIDNFKCSPANSIGLTCILSQNSGSNVGLSHRILNCTIEGGADVTGIYYDMPSSGNWEHIHIDKLHLEGVGVSSGYAIFLHSVRHGGLSEIRLGGSTGQIVRIENCIWVPIENSTLIDLVITADCIYCGPINCEVSNYTNLVTVPKQFVENTSVIGGRLENTYGTSTLAFSGVELQANSGGTWTGGTKTNLAYKIDNDILHLQVEIENSSVTVGAATTQLFFALPASLVPKFRAWGLCKVVNAGGVAALGYMEVTAPGYIVFYRDLTGTTNWSAASSNTSIYASISFPVTIS